jgi:hypothetical protein
MKELVAWWIVMLARFRGPGFGFWLVGNAGLAVALPELLPLLVNRDVPNIGRILLTFGGMAAFSLVLFALGCQRFLSVRRSEHREDA